MPAVVFFPSLVSIEAADSELLLSVAQRAGVLIDASCDGVGACGVCKVRVECDDPAPFTDHELDLLSESERECGYRLACQYRVGSDCRIFIPSNHGGSGRKKRMVRMPEGFAAGERVHRKAVKVPRAKLGYQANDVDRVRAELGIGDLKVDPMLLNGLHGALMAQRGKASFVLDGCSLVSVEPGSSDECYGIAFDIGTTTVVGMLWDLATAELLDVESSTNYQSLHGADVISRIAYSMAEEGNLHSLQQAVIRCCNDILEEICARNGLDPAHIVDAVMDGNTTMSHLALGVAPESMARTPFAPVFCESQNTRASSIGLAINPFANVHFMPIVAGHVGSDIVGMMIAADLDGLAGCHVAIDIGTNGEVVVVKDGQMTCCSTAAGPAFEGATIGCGMRAAPGAIEKVDMSGGEVLLETIDGADACGICGSGLIDAVAWLLENGVVDESGKMRTRRECIDAGVPEPIAQRVDGEGLDARFALVRREGCDDIVLTQGDIREVQLAKGAILAGIQTLMKELGIELGDLSSIMLAGAFGNYIDKESALRIGLLPQVDAGKVVPIGNAAGVGCCMALLSKEERLHAEQVARKTRHIELSKNEDFQDFYIDAMTFRL